MAAGTDSGEARSATRRRVTLATASGVALALAGVAFVVRALLHDREAVADALGGAHPAWVAAAVVLAALGMTAVAVPWGRGLRLLGAPVGDLRHVPWYFVGEIGKYVPGGVWPVLGRGEMARRRGVGAAAAYGSVALSLAALYLAAMALAVVLLPLRMAGGDADGSRWWLVAPVLLPIGLLALHPGPVGLGLRLVERLLHREVQVIVPSWSETLRYVASYVPAWTCIAGATWLVARALTPDAGDDVGGIAFAAVLSWIAGFLAVPVPGGVGVREAVFVAVAGLEPGVGAAVALVARAVFMSVDAVGALGAAAWLAHREAGAGPSGSLGAAADTGAPAVARRRGR